MWKKCLCVLLFFHVSRSSGLIEIGETVRCPGGTLASGMTISIPGSAYWRDPSQGPPPQNAKPIPMSVCLKCGHMTETDQKLPENVEEFVAFHTNKAVHQSCVGKGDLTRTLSQKFECEHSAFLRTFSKNDSDLNSQYSCYVPVEIQGQRRNGTKTLESTYEARFPVTSGRSNARARTNWRDVQTHIKCDKYGEFICGLQIFMDGKFPEPKQQQQETNLDNNEEESINLEEEYLRRGPQFSALCCRGRDVMGKSSAEFVSAGCLGTSQATIAVLAVIVSLMALALLLCTFNLCCWQMMPEKCSVGSTCCELQEVPPKYGDNNSTVGSAAANGTRSEFNTRPNTGKPNNNVLINNKVHDVME